jgi:hypothetical protein
LYLQYWAASMELCLFLLYHSIKSRSMFSNDVIMCCWLYSMLCVYMLIVMGSFVFFSSLGLFTMKRDWWQSPKRDEGTGLSNVAGEYHTKQGYGWCKQGELVSILSWLPWFSAPSLHAGPCLIFLSLLCVVFGWCFCLLIWKMIVQQSLMTYSTCYWNCHILDYMDKWVCG